MDTALNTLIMSDMFSMPLTETHDAEGGAKVEVQSQERGDCTRHPMTSEVEMHVDDYDEEIEKKDETDLVQEEGESEECTVRRDGLEKVVMLLENS